MTVKLLTEHHLEFLGLKGGCRGLSESTLVKMPHCWKSHVLAHLCLNNGDHGISQFVILNSMWWMWLWITHIFYTRGDLCRSLFCVVVLCTRSCSTMDSLMKNHLGQKQNFGSYVQKLQVDAPDDVIQQGYRGLILGICLLLRPCNKSK